MRYIFLTNDFYKDYSDCPEIEQKLSRPYIQVCVEIDNQIYAIPLRSNINHSYALWTNKRAKCGLDFSKTVLLTNPQKYICTNLQPYIRKEEFEALRGKEYLIKTKLIKYIKKYKKALQKRHIKANDDLCKYSTLQYFEDYINNF